MSEQGNEVTLAAGTDAVESHSPTPPALPCPPPPPHQNTLAPGRATDVSKDANEGASAEPASSPSDPPAKASAGRSRRVSLQTAPLASPATAAATDTPEDGAAPSEAAHAPTDTMDTDKDEDEPAPGTVPQKRARSASPDEPEADGPATLARPTVRLQVQVKPGGSSKSDYIIPVPKLSVSRMESKHPQWARWYQSTYLETEASHSGYQSVGLSNAELDDLGDLAKLLQKYPTQSTSGGARRRRGDEYDVGSYDVKDPFVDDSELGVDEPTHIVRTRSDGFYVALGPIELARAKPSHLSSHSSSAFRSGLARDGWAGYARQTNKLLAKRAAKRSQSHVSAKPKAASAADDDASAAAPSDDPGTPDAQEADTNEAKAATSASSVEKAEGKKSKYPMHPVHPELQKRFDHLAALAQRASFAVKTKFPPELKPPLIDAAKLAVELGEYNDNFFNYLPSIFPYNRFTMMKLTKREFFHKHLGYYRELQEEHLDKLYRLIQEDYPRQVAEYAAVPETADTSDAPPPKDAEEDISTTSTQSGDEDDANDDNLPSDDEREDEREEKEAVEESTDRDDAGGAGDGVTSCKRFRWSDAMRDELFTIITVENAMSEIRNEKLKLENSPESYSEINARKALYKRIADFIPNPAWIHTTQISREYGLAKKRRDRLDAMELDGA